MSNYIPWETISHSLGLGDKTMVYPVYLTMFL